MSPVAAQAIGDLRPDVEDADGGLVGMRGGFSLKSYTAIVIVPLTVSASEIKDADDVLLAKDMAAYLQTQLIKNLQAAGIFGKVLDGTASGELPAGSKVLRLEGQITRLTEGSQLERYFIGFGAGAAKAQIETRLLDLQSQRIEMVTADRRAAGLGIFGGDSRQFLTESMDQMAENYVKLLKHLAGGGRPGPR